MSRLAVSYEGKADDSATKRRRNTPDKLLIELGRQQLAYSRMGLLLGLGCILGGVLLFFRGVTGSTTWVANLVGAESKMTDAAPGVILFVVGLLLVFITRYMFKIKA